MVAVSPPELFSHQPGQIETLDSDLAHSFLAENEKNTLRNKDNSVPQERISKFPTCCQELSHVLLPGSSLGKPPYKIYLLFYSMLEWNYKTLPSFLFNNRTIVPWSPSEHSWVLGLVQFPRDSFLLLDEVEKEEHLALPGRKVFWICGRPPSWCKNIFY